MCIEAIIRDGKIARVKSALRGHGEGLLLSFERDYGSERAALGLLVAVFLGCASTRERARARMQLTDAPAGCSCIRAQERAGRMHIERPAAAVLAFGIAPHIIQGCTKCRGVCTRARHTRRRCVAPLLLPLSHVAVTPIPACFRGL